ncbi:hypothetical protein RJ639_026717 [Escallonia herrerae]|uniref:Retrotransposon gag domain-containing protein n=1 Tax=Escallonia herrerae TaxID=1293975 RepID=A0AA88XEP9_9ASTE|nr:hypothetical protein RJ639_026717 [Escallonia herrerae]
MKLHLVPDQICRAFPVTLKGAAHVWFQHLAPRSISCWAQLAESFRSNFLTSRIQRKNSSALFHIVQGPKESLKSYYTRFNTEKLLIDNLDLGDEGTSGQKRHDSLKLRIPEEPKRSWATIFKHLTPLTISREHILNQIKSQNILKWPKPIRMPTDIRDAQLYCHFHKDHGHTTEECKVLQREIENLIVKGHLKQFVKANERQGGWRGGSQRRHKESVPKDPPVINTISGGLSARETSKSAQKAYARQVNLTQGPAKCPRPPTTISFDDTDLEEVITPHDDALVISLQIDAYVIKRILVDTGSSADILFEEAFSQMQISRERIRSVSSPLYGFTGASAPVEGVIPLTVVAGKYPLQATQSIDFLVVKVKSTYNGILGRAGLNKFQAVASMFHLCMKFSTLNRIGVVKGDQDVARKCYMASCRVEDAFAIEDQRDEHTFIRAESHCRPKESEEVQILTGWIAVLSRFLSKSAERCLPLFKALKNIKNFEWTAECQASFETLKNYLSALPLIFKPLVGEELFLYLAISDSAITHYGKFMKASVVSTWEDALWHTMFSDKAITGLLCSNML